MSIELLPHGQQAYENVKKIFEKDNRAVVIHPTGTGKSYIALKLAEENPDKKMLYIAPSLPILDQIERNSKENGINNIQTITYQKLLMMLKNGEIENLSADYIVTDEFHHYTGDRWADALDMLLANNVDAKVLGLSATPLRYGVKGIVRDTADELFENNIASEMTTEEAISKGILPEPDYTVGIYDYVDIMEYLKRLTTDKMDDKEIAQKYKEIEEKLKKAVDTLPDLLAEKMTKKNGKYLVFCASVEDMKQKMEEAQKMFSKVNPNITVRSVSSKDNDHQENKAIISEFENDNNPETLKLLFCVDMLNEGYHPKDIDGGIMLRKTSSPTLYIQQLGRMLSVANGKKPIILDLVNNIDSIQQIEDFTRSLNVLNRDNKKKNFNFHINRLTVDIFAKIDELNKRVKRNFPELYMIRKLLKKIDNQRKLISNDSAINPRFRGLEEIRKRENAAKDGSKEQITLSKLYKNQRDSIITDNMWLAEEIAKQIDVKGMEEEDKIQLAYMGLMHTVDTFSVAGSRKFSVMCVKNILQTIKENKKRNSIDYYFKPSHKQNIIDAMKIVNDAEVYLQQKLCKEEISSFDISIETDFPIAIVEDLRVVSKEFEKRDNPESFEDYESDDVESVISSPAVEPDLNYTIDQEVLHDELSYQLDNVGGYSRIALKLYYGLEDGKAHTYEEIGKRLSVTGSTVGHRVNKGLKIMWGRYRLNSRARGLGEFLHIDNRSKLPIYTGGLDYAVERLSDSDNQKLIRKVVLQKRLKEAKIPEKQRLQKEYGELMKEKSRKKGE